MKPEVEITISGPVGCAKSALMFEIAEFLTKKHNLQVVFSDPAAATSELNMGAAEESFRQEMIQSTSPLVKIKEVVAT